MNHLNVFRTPYLSFSCWAIVLVVVASSALCQASPNGGSTGKSPLTSKKEFHQLFRQKRATQLQAVKSLLAMDKYERRHSMVQTILQKLFEVIDKARAVTENSAYIPGGEEDSSKLSLPTDQVTLEALSSIIENCALLGDIVLRLPDISASLMKENHSWLVGTRWCISFSNATGLIDDTTVKMLNLVAQELDLIPKDPQYFNPYRKSSNPFNDVPSSKKFSPLNSNKEPVKQKEKPKKKIQSGPRLSRGAEL